MVGRAHFFSQLQHSLGDLVRIGTCVYRLWSFDRDVPVQRSVRHSLRCLMAFPRPVVEIDALFFPRRELGLELFLDGGGELVDGFDASDALDKLRVPNSVQSSTERSW